MATNVTITASDLPDSLNLPPHLSAHKYFFVCTLTVAAWDSLVLSPRSIKLLRTDGWPILKAVFCFLRVLMPIEFVIVGVAFFDTQWSSAMCQRFYLFEPICTAILLAACSLVHLIRVHAIYDQDRRVLFSMGALFAVQVIVTGVCCGFFRSVPLKEGQGCIAGPRANWVGIYWLSATLLYTASTALALNRSIKSLEQRRISLWKLMLRDGLNLYGAIWVVNMINMLFWFIVKPTDGSDTVRTIVTSMTAVLTTTMTLRIILSIRGPLNGGGHFAGIWSTSSGTRSATVPQHGASILQISSGAAPTYTLDAIGQKGPTTWNDAPVGKALESKEAASIVDEDSGRDAFGRAPGLQRPIVNEQ